MSKRAPNAVFIAAARERAVDAVEHGGDDREREREARECRTALPADQPGEKGRERHARKRELVRRSEPRKGMVCAEVHQHEHRDGREDRQRLRDVQRSERELARDDGRRGRERDRHQGNHHRGGVRRAHTA